MFRQVVKFFTREWVVVSLLVIAGGLVRFANFPNTMFWTNDVSRDMLVAWQIAAQDHWPTVGHFNTGVQGYYQPYYFYFLGMLAKIGGAPDFIYACFITLHTVSLVGIYVTARNLFGKRAGFVALALSAVAGSFLDLSRFPTVAPWSWPFYILSLSLFSFWFATQNRNYLWFAVLISFLAVQVHGAQLVFLSGLLLLLAWQKLSKSEWLGWFGTIVALAVNQHALIRALVVPIAAPTSQFDWQGFAVIFQLFLETVITNVAFFYTFCFLFALTIGWLFLKQRDGLVSHAKSWQFLGGFILFFEVLLGSQKTGALAHHQFYVAPLVIVLVSGLLVHLQLPFGRVKRMIYKAILLSLFTVAVMIPSLREIGAYQDYFQTQVLYAELKQKNLPLQNATVFMTDNEKSRLGDASNSTELWWFLARDLGRSDFNPVVWSFTNFTPQLLLICNTKYSKASGISCDDQFTKILSKSQRRYTLFKTVTLSQQIEVRLYTDITSDVSNLGAM